MSIFPETGTRLLAANAQRGVGCIRTCTMPRRAFAYCKTGAGAILQSTREAARGRAFIGACTRCVRGFLQLGVIIENVGRMAKNRSEHRRDASGAISRDVSHSEACEISVFAKCRALSRLSVWLVPSSSLCISSPCEPNLFARGANPRPSG